MLVLSDPLSFLIVLKNCFMSSSMSSFAMMLFHCVSDSVMYAWLRCFLAEDISCPSIGDGPNVRVIMWYSCMMFCCSIISCVGAMPGRTLCFMVGMYLLEARLTCVFHMSSCWSISVGVMSCVAGVGR